MTSNSPVCCAPEPTGIFGLFGTAAWIGLRKLISKYK
ncbi:PEP-CTERM sorting domain-containing protein [Candidatus Amesbacteria bacterium]|nr:PEP-CTERM sorting domain-containing protein [Candidatus Amesbacteria bacterium]